MKIKDISFGNVNEFDLGRIERSRRALGTLVVAEDTPAIDVAKAVDALGAQASVVVLVDSNDFVSGLFVPEDFMQKWQRSKGIQTERLTDALITLESDSLNPAHDSLRQMFTLDRPLLGWCEIGAHETILPCRIHS